MSSPHSLAREHMVDSVKATPVAGMLAAWLGGISINEWAAAAGFAYTVILIVDKLRQMGLFRWIARRFTRAASQAEGA